MIILSKPMAKSPMRKKNLPNLLSSPSNKERNANASKNKHKNMNMTRISQARCLSHGYSQLKLNAMKNMQPNKPNICANPEKFLLDM